MANTKDFTEVGKIKSLVTGENIKTPLDFDNITTRDKEIAETVLQNQCFSSHNLLWCRGHIA